MSTVVVRVNDTNLVVDADVVVSTLRMSSIDDVIDTLEVRGTVTETEAPDVVIDSATDVVHYVFDVRDALDELGTKV